MVIGAPLFIYLLCIGCYVLWYGAARYRTSLSWLLADISKNTTIYIEDMAIYEVGSI